MGWCSFWSSNAADSPSVFHNISWWNKSRKLHRMFDFETIFDFRQMLIYLINSMVNLISADFAKIFTSKSPTWRGQIPRMADPIANPFGDIIWGYNKSLDFILYRNWSTLGTSFRTIHRDRTQVKNEAWVGRLQRSRHLYGTLFGWNLS